MTSKITGMMLVRNEAARWLESALEQMAHLCERIVVLDDASTDETPEICDKYGAIVHLSEKSLFETDQSALWERLWKHTTEVTDGGDWILSLAADETMEERALSDLPKMISLAEKNELNGLGLWLYDMWDEHHYRDDLHWSTKRGVWVVARRYDPKVDYAWRKQQSHVGRLPYKPPMRVLVTPLRIQHWGYSRPEYRQYKYERQKRTNPGYLWGSKEHYEGIFGEPNLVKWEE